MKFLVDLTNPMQQMIFIAIVLSLFIICSDIRHRKISNTLIFGVLIMSTITAWNNNFLLDSLLNALMIFVFFFALWSVNVLGGGDVKLIAAFSVGVTPPFIIQMLCLIGLLGGVQLVLIYFWSNISKKSLFKKGIPYGLPITLSGLIFMISSMNGSIAN